MNNLITIETVPIKVEFVEKQNLALSSVHSTQMQVNRDQGYQQIKSQPVRIALQDSFEPSMDYNWENSTYTAVSRYDQDGNLQLDIRMEDGQAKAIRFKQVNRSIESMSSQAASSTMQSGSMQISIPLTQLPGGMPEVNNVKTQFLPPDLQLVVTQRPDVVIKYVGGPIYVPPSADPNYQPLIGFEQSQAKAQTAQLLDETV